MNLAELKTRVRENMEQEKKNQAERRRPHGDHPEADFRGRIRPAALRRG